MKRKLTNMFWLKEKLKRRCGHETRVLDFGCGTGELIKICDDLPLDMYGCDLIIYENHLNARFKSSHAQLSRIKKIANLIYLLVVIFLMYAFQIKFLNMFRK